MARARRPPGGSGGGGEVSLAAEDRPLLTPDEREAPRDKALCFSGAVLHLTLVTGIGGFLFGYDTGVVAGALPYIRATFPAVARSAALQEAVVAAALAGAAAGAACGGWLADAVGRKNALLYADVAFVAGALALAAAPHPAVLVFGRLVVGLGVGVASMVVPVYIAEVAPADTRAALVSVNTLLITFGQFVSYLVNYALTDVAGTWRWMLGVAGVPAVLQLVSLVRMPESPRWLARRGYLPEAEAALGIFCTSTDAHDELESLLAEPPEPAARGLSALLAPELRGPLRLGLGLQALQQFCGINTLMYYTPTLLQFAGYGTRDALLFSLLPAFVNMSGSIVGIALIDSCGRRKLMLASLLGVLASLVLIGVSFDLSSQHPLAVSDHPRGGAQPCSTPASTCSECVAAGTCGFCAAPSVFPRPPQSGACLAPGSEHACVSEGGTWVAAGDGTQTECPSQYGALAVLGLCMYLAAFSPGCSPVPWAVNAEIYPTHVRGLAAGAATTTNWVANFVVGGTFLSLTSALGVSRTFYAYACIAAAGAVWVYGSLPETRGLTLEEVETLFRQRARTATGGERASA